MESPLHIAADNFPPFMHDLTFLAFVYVLLLATFLRWRSHLPVAAAAATAIRRPSPGTTQSLDLRMKPKLVWMGPPQTDVSLLNMVILDFF
jgi:hypothetical protein